jgi:hypothetical protein
MRTVNIAVLNCLSADLFLCCLFNDAVSSADFVVLVDVRLMKSEGMCKEAVVAWFKVPSQHLLGGT